MHAFGKECLMGGQKNSFGLSIYNLTATWQRGYFRFIDFFAKLFFIVINLCIWEFVVKMENIETIHE